MARRRIVVPDVLKLLWEEARAIAATRQAVRSFGLTVGVLLALIGAVLWWRNGWVATPWVYGWSGVGLALVLLGLVWPRGLTPVYRVWMGLAVVLGFVMTRVILSLVFFAVVTPIALVFRLLRRDPLSRKPDPEQPTYWLPKTYRDETPGRLEKYY